MTIVNFSHPLTAEQRLQIEMIAGGTSERVIDVPTHFDEDQPFADQVVTLVARSGLSAEEWETLPIVVNLPSYGPIVAVLLAYIHGLCGHFPTVIRLRPGSGTSVTKFDLGELINLQSVRLQGRKRRSAINE